MPQKDNFTIMSMTRNDQFLGQGRFQWLVEQVLLRETRYIAEKNVHFLKISITIYKQNKYVKIFDLNGEKPL